MYRQVLSRFVILMLVTVALGGTISAHAAGSDADIVLSEVMFDPVSGSGEWVELYNSGVAAVDIAGWTIEDNSSSDTITTSMCPGGSCSIPAGDTWLITDNQSDLSTEFSNYTPSPSVDMSRTIFLGGSIGSGLNNTGDRLVLRSTNAVDCVAYDGFSSTLSCSSLTYVAGGDGQDTSADGTGDRSIANIQGTWQDHELNASPYDEQNSGQGGSPTAITLASAVADTQIDQDLMLLTFGGGVLLAVVLLFMGEVSHA